jgi:hypothetical protein
VVSDGVRTSKPAFATVTVSGSKNSQWLAQATLDAMFSFEEYESARAAKREFTLPDATAECLLENER